MQKKNFIDEDQFPLEIYLCIASSSAAAWNSMLAVPNFSRWICTNPVAKKIYKDLFVRVFSGDRYSGTTVDGNLQSFDDQPSLVVDKSGVFTCMCCKNKPAHHYLEIEHFCCEEHRKLYSPFTEPRMAQSIYSYWHHKNSLFRSASRPYKKIVGRVQFRERLHFWKITSLFLQSGEIKSVTSKISLPINYPHIDDIHSQMKNDKELSLQWIKCKRRRVRRQNPGVWLYVAQTDPSIWKLLLCVPQFARWTISDAVAAQNIVAKLFCKTTVIGSSRWTTFCGKPVYFSSIPYVSVLLGVDDNICFRCSDADRFTCDHYSSKMHFCCRDHCTIYFKGRERKTPVKKVFLWKKKKNIGVKDTNLYLFAKEVKKEQGKYQYTYFYDCRYGPITVMRRENISAEK